MFSHLIMPNLSLTSSFLLLLSCHTGRIYWCYPTSQYGCSTAVPYLVTIHGLLGTPTTWHGNRLRSLKGDGICWFCCRWNQFLFGVWRLTRVIQYLEVIFCCLSGTDPRRHFTTLGIPVQMHPLHRVAKNFVFHPLKLWFSRKGRINF